MKFDHDFYIVVSNWVTRFKFEAIAQLTWTKQQQEEQKRKKKKSKFFIWFIIKKIWKKNSFKLFKILHISKYRVICHYPSSISIKFHFSLFIFLCYYYYYYFYIFLILRHCVVIDLYVYCQLKQMVIEPPWAQYSYQCGETISQILTRREKKWHF